MLKLVHSQTHSIQDDPSTSEDGKTTPSKLRQPQLRLVVSNPDPVRFQATPIIKELGFSSPFTVTLRQKGPYLYEMGLYDLAHDLNCDLILEVRQPQDVAGDGIVVCHFPFICGEALNSLIEEDDTLYGIIMIQFQMKILEQLFLFCATHNAPRMVIYTDDDQAKSLGIYDDFLAYKDQTLSSRGEKIEMIIPTDTQTFDEWVDFMEDVSVKFRQTLWQDQRFNLAIKNYLKKHPLG